MCPDPVFCRECALTPIFRAAVLPGDGLARLALLFQLAIEQLAGQLSFRKEV
jgi:hypothetical protein